MSVDSKNIKAIIFDWGGVCCRAAEPFASLKLQEVLSMDPDTIAEQVRQIHDDYYKGKFDSITFWNSVIDNFNLKQDVEINPAMLAAAYRNSYAIYPEVLKAILSLRARYKVALLSNLTPEMRDHIKEAHQTSRYFDPEQYSCDKDVQSMKPTTEPFKIMLGKLQFFPQNCLFIDDSLKNIEAARQLGFQVILFKSPKQLLEELKPLIF